MKKKEWRGLLAIFLVIFILRLVISFTTPNLTYDSYFHLRQVESITETGMPLFDDPLSYGGSTHRFLPTFHYLAAGFNLILPIEIVSKVLPNLLLSLLVIIIYVISKQLTNDHSSSLISSFIAGLLPATFYTNSFVPETLFFPLIFLTIYAFLKATKEKKATLYIISFILASLTSGATGILLVGFLVYIGLSILEKKKISRVETELIIFSFFFYTWSQFLFFKESIIRNGISFIWQNVPPQIIQEYFPSFSIGQSLLLVSIIPFIVGIFVVYRSLFELKRKTTFFIISLVIATTLLTWFQLIQFKHSLSFFGLTLAILFSVFFKDLEIYLNKTKIAWVKRWTQIAMIILLLITMLPFTIVAAQSQNLPSNEEIDAFIWLKNNTPENSTVLSLIEEGHLISYFSERKNIMDSKFGGITDIDKKFKDIDSLFKTKFETEAIELLNKYSVDYTILTLTAKEKYPGALSYREPKCFKRIYKNETRIYEGKCVLGELTNE